MSKENLRSRIKEYCKNKHFDNTFVQACIIEFMERHFELYGDIVPIEDVFERLESNLNKITFIGQKASFNGELGEYIGRIADGTDRNEILLYYAWNRRKTYFLRNGEIVFWKRMMN